MRLSRLTPLAVAVAVYATACESSTGPAAGFAATLSASALAVDQVQSATVALNIVRSDFTGALTPRVEGLPSGVTASFDPASLDGSSIQTTLTLTAGSAAPAGPAALQVKVAGAGVTEQSLNLALTVAAVATSDVSIPFCTGLIPDWFVFQNTNGKWVRVTGTPTATGSTFTFPATEKVAIAMMTTADSPPLHVVHATAVELRQMAMRICAPNTGTKTLNGTVTGLGTAPLAVIMMGNRTVSAAATYQLSSLAAGPLNLFALKLSPTAGAPATAAIVRRGIDLATASAIPVLNFSASEAQPMSTANLSSSSPLGAGESMSYYALLQSGVDQLIVGTSTGSASGSVGVLPPSLLQTGEYYVVLMQYATSTTGVYRNYQRVTASLADMSLPIGPVPAMPTNTAISASPYYRARTQVASQAEYGAAIRTCYEQSGVGNCVMVTAGYSGGTPANWDVALPDFAGVVGFNQSWMVKSGIATNWRVYYYGGRPPLSFTPALVIGDGFAGAGRSVSFTAAPPPAH